MKFLFGTRLQVIVWIQSPTTKQLDYSLGRMHWFSLPELNDDADIILKELENEVQETKEADVF